MWLALGSHLAFNFARSITQLPLSLPLCIHSNTCDINNNNNMNNNNIWLWLGSWLRSSALSIMAGLKFKFDTRTN